MFADSVVDDKNNAAFAHPYHVGKSNSKFG